ncbi:MAG TPA: DUF4129 domain-containing protein, partial [Polyangia bacterium]|nr:DUF4129 domain-containing protein [Polyangia bacterium]
PAPALPFRALLWIVLAAAAAAIIYSIARHVVAQRAPDHQEVDVITTEAPEDPAAAIARQVETDVQRLLARARAAAAAGDFGTAVDDAYAALLRKLEGAGIVTVESHRTNGDHVRDVGRQLPTLRPRLQTVVTNVEQVQFGGAAPTEGRFRSVLADVLGLLSEKLAGWLPFVVKLGLGLALAGAVSSCHVNREGWDRSPSGRSGVVELLEHYGFTPRERLASLSKLDTSVSALLLLPGATDDVDANWPVIANWVAEGGTLLVAGGKRSLPSWIGVTIVGDKATAATTPPLTIPKEAGERLPKLKAVVPSRREVELAVSVSRSDDGSEEAPPAILLVRGKANYAVERTYEGGGRAIVLADDLLLTNASLLVDDNARLLIELLRPGGPKLEIAGELTGLVSKSPIDSVKRGRLAPAMLQLLLLILLFFAHKGAFFGLPIGDPSVVKRRRFSEHARAIGLLYGRNRAGRHALELYGSYALERMRERLNLTGGKSLLAVAEELATRTGRPLGEVMRVLVESRPVKREGDPERERLLQEANSARDLATMRDIASLLQHGTQGGSQSPAPSPGRQTQPSLVAITTGGTGERSGSQRQA